MSKVHINLDGKTVLVTGSPGFIGANLVSRLLKEMKSGVVISFDCMNDYYDSKIKEYRLKKIEEINSPVEHIFIKVLLIRHWWMRFLRNINLQLW